MSCLAYGDGVLVSGSWDCTGRIWKNGQCIQELKGHEGPIWAIALLPGQPTTTILTASADKTIRMWRDGKVGYDGFFFLMGNIIQANPNPLVSAYSTVNIYYIFRIIIFLIELLS